MALSASSRLARALGASTGSARTVLPSLQCASTTNAPVNVQGASVLTQARHFDSGQPRFSETLSNPNLRRQSMARRTFGTLAEAEDIDINNPAYGFMAKQAIFAGLELGVYDHIASAGPAGLTAEQLGKACGVTAPRTTTLLTALVSLRSLRLSVDGRYTCSPSSMGLLVKKSKTFLFKGFFGCLQKHIFRQVYRRMGGLSDIMVSGKTSDYASRFSDPETADTYTRDQHHRSMATANDMGKEKLQLSGVSKMLDVGGGSGAFSYVFAQTSPGLQSIVLELPEVCRVGEKIRSEMEDDVQKRVSFKLLDTTSPDWPVPEANFDLVLMSFLSGSVAESDIARLYSKAFKALRPGGRLVVHDYMVNDSLDGPTLGALWSLQHVTANADALGLCPKHVIMRMGSAGFDARKCETQEIIEDMTKLVIAHKA